MRYVSAPLAAGIWLATLTLRAMVAIGSVIFVLLYLPQTELFKAIAALCLHTVVPLITAHLGFSGHGLADVALILPALALAGSLVVVGLGLLRGALALTVRLRERAVGAGPLGSTVVEEPGIVVAVTRLGKPRLFISRAALAALDDEELAASLAHEWGHVRRWHRPLLVAASLLAALARFLPGTRRAERELALSLERDADAFAVSATRTPLALASAICKACPQPAVGSAAAALGGGGSAIGARLDPLIGIHRPRPALERTARLLAAVLTVQALALALTLPAWALASPASRGATVPAACND